MRQLFLCLNVIFMTGCANYSDSIDLKPYTKLSCDSVSILTPHSFSDNSWWTWQLSSNDLIAMERQIPNMMSEDVRIMVSTHPKDRIPKVDMLYKKTNDQMEEYERNYQMSDWEKKNNAERGVTYVKRYVDFIGGLKCATRVESSNLALGVGTKSYQTNCNYFDDQSGAKNIHLDYRYTYTHSGTKHEDDTKSSTVTPEAMQNQFKQDIKAIFDSLVIHDMHRERMQKEGLLHDKEYEIQEW